MSFELCMSFRVFYEAFASYVDHQLRKSRRFDAEGIQRDHPELFEPLPRRRSSSSNSLSSLSSSSTHQDDLNMHQEGQLRYWTSDMCSNSPHLFDFVITVSDPTRACCWGHSFRYLAWRRWHCSFYVMALSANCSSRSPFRTRLTRLSH